MRQIAKKILLTCLAILVFVATSFVAPQPSRAAGIQWYIADYIREHSAYQLADQDPVCEYDRGGLAQKIADDLARNDARATLTCTFKANEQDKKNKNVYYTFLYDEDNAIQRIENGTHSIDQSDNGYCQLMPYANDLYVCYYGRYQEKVSFEVVLNKSLTQQFVSANPLYRTLEVAKLIDWFDAAINDFKDGLVVAVTYNPPEGLSRNGLGTLTNTEWKSYQDARKAFDEEREAIRSSTLKRSAYENLVTAFDAERSKFVPSANNPASLCAVDAGATRGSDEWWRSKACADGIMADLNRYKRVLDQYASTLAACVDQDGKRITSDACTQAIAAQKQAVDGLERTEQEIAANAAKQNDVNEGASNTARGICSDSLPSIGEVADGFGTWMGCAVAYGLISTKKFIIDSWLIQGENDSFGNVLNIADPTLGESNLVVSVWSIIRDVVNALVLISILIMALLNATGFTRSKTLESFQFQRLIPSIVVAVILVNFSLAICNFFIIAANALTNYMVGAQGLKGIASAAGTGFDSIAGKTPGTALLQSLFLVAFSLILLYLYILLWVRVVVISLLVMTSGLPYIARILPFKYVQETVSSFWTKQFVNWLLMGPMVGLLVYIAARAIAGLGQSAFLLPQGTSDAASGSPTLTNLIVVTVILYIAATYPLKLGGDIMKRAQGYLKQAREGAGTFARRTAKGVAVAGQKDGASEAMRKLGKVASTGLFVAAMPKYLNEQYKAIEESRDKALGKTWGKGKIRQFVERPLDEKKTEDEADKLKTKSVTAIEAKARSSKGWQDRAQGIWAAVKKSTEALTEEERQEAARLARDLGYTGDLNKGDWKEIVRLAQSESTILGSWGGLNRGATPPNIPDRLRTATLRDIGRVKIDELSGREFDEVEDAFMDAQSIVQPHNDRVYANIEQQLIRIFGGRNNLSSSMLAKIRKEVEDNNPAEIERIIKNAAYTAGVNISKDDWYGDGISTPHTGIMTHIAGDALYQSAQQNAQQDAYYNNTRALMGRIKTSQQAAEVRRYDDYVIRQNIDPVVVRSTMQRDLTSLRQAASTSYEQGLLKLKELRQPSYDSRIVTNADGSINMSRTKISERELASIIESMEEVSRLVSSGDSDDRQRIARLRSSGRQK